MFERLINLFRRPSAHFQRGQRYENGDGVAQDYAQARACYEAAGAYPEALVALGRLYYYGWGGA